MSKKALLASGLVIISLVVSATAFAATNYSDKQQREHFGTSIGYYKMPAVVGTVTNISGSTITLTAKNGTVYTVDAASAKITKNNSPIQIANIAIGDTLAIIGNTNGTNISATNIIDGILKPTGEFKANRFSGQITAISGSSFTIESKGFRLKTSDSQNVNTDSKTTFTKNGVAATFADLAIGERVVVTGTLDSANKVIIATNINIIVNSAGTNFMGTIKSVSGNSLTITDKKGNNYTVDAGSAKIIQGKNKNSTITALKAGEKIIVFGSQASGTTNISASVIRIIPQNLKKNS
jgi:hypothetical protein